MNWSSVLADYGFYVATLAIPAAIVGAAADRRWRGAGIGLAVGLVAGLVVGWYARRWGYFACGFIVLLSMVPISLLAIIGGSIWRGRGAAVGGAIGLGIAVLFWAFMGLPP